VKLATLVALPFLQGMTWRARWKLWREVCRELNAMSEAAIQQFVTEAKRRG
jgi:hypothetical protein